MTSTTPSSAALAYIDCDVPAEPTLAAWRRKHDGARDAARTPRRSLRLPRLRLRWAT